MKLQGYKQRTTSHGSCYVGDEKRNVIACIENTGAPETDFRLAKLFAAALDTAEELERVKRYRNAAINKWHNAEALVAEMLNTCERLLGIVRSIKDDDEYTKEVKHRAALMIAKAKKV